MKNNAITIYHNQSCSKSRGCFTMLNDKKIEFETIEYLKNPLTKEQLIALLSKLGIPAKDLVRRGEYVFLENYQGKELTESEWIDAMVKFTILIERPIVVRGDKAIIGRPIEKVFELLEA